MRSQFSLKCSYFSVTRHIYHVFKVTCYRLIRGVEPLYLSICNLESALFMPYVTVVRRFSKTMSNIETVQVQVVQGILRGKKVDAKYGGTFYSFQGIPYAKPPVGDLRFQPPQPPVAWEGVRDALIEGPVAPHTDWIRHKYRGEEDCLFLNVYCPQNPEVSHTSLHPVMVWIHGGGFGFGSGNSDMYGADFLVKAGVIVVTLNYRLGALGFLSLEDVNVPGNNGLKDQVAALRWVQQNIKRFGGDPNNVTIFGESAGGAAVQYHMLSPMSKGLFHRAIAQSGSVLNPWARAQSLRKRSFDLGATLGFNSASATELIAFLKTFDAKEIVEATAKILTNEDKRRNNSIPFLPIVEKEEFGEVFLPADPKELIKLGRINKVPYLTGVTSHEGIMEIRDILRKPQLLKEIEQDFERFIPQSLNVDENSKEAKSVADRIRKFYFHDKEINKDSILSFVDLQTDVMFAHGVHSTVNLYSSKIDVPLYYYHFCFDGALGIFKRFLGAAHLPGVCHIDDIGYLFHMSFVNLEVSNESPEMKTMHRMVKMWTNFAKTGNPTPELDSNIPVMWTPFTKTNPAFMNINSDLSIKHNHLKDRMEFWDSIYEDILSSK